MPFPPPDPYAPPATPIGVVRKYRHGGPAELATIGQRFSAALLNGLMLFGCALPAMATAFLVERGPQGRPESTISSALLFVSLLAILGLLIYNAVILTVSGQSLGKRWMGIRIVSIEANSHAGFVKCIILRGLVHRVICSIPVVGALYMVVDLCCIFGQERRCLHDQIAGTRVVQVL